jgi:hypothetical protein
MTTLNNLCCGSNQPLRQFAWFAAVLTLSASYARAETATWNMNPIDGNWNNPANWTPQIIPSLAIFSTSSQTDVFLSDFADISELRFSPGASAYTITALPGKNLHFGGGSGIVNDSGAMQNFVAVGADRPGPSGSFSIDFDSSAGSSTVFTTTAAKVVGGDSGFIQFIIQANAGDGTFINEGSSVPGAEGGLTDFINSTQAANATIENLPGMASGANPGVTRFDFT